MSRYGTYDLKYGFIPDDDCPQQETPKQTNGDRIRSMTDEELAKLFNDMIIKCEGLVPCSRYCPSLGNAEKTCEEAWLLWLKEKVKE